MAVIQNGKRNFIKKEYYRLLEVIEILGCTVDDLIHLAANKKLLISVIPFRDIGKKSNSGINLKLLDSKFWQIIERNEPQVFENWNGDEGIKVIEAKEFFPISDNYVISQSELEKLQQYILANIDNAKNSTFKSEALADDGAVKPKSEQATELQMT